MSLDVKGAAQLINSYKEYNTKAAKAIVDSNTEEELNQNMENLGAFDFQQDKAYSRQLTNLALGDLLETDKNGDGTINLQEYIDAGVEAYSGIIDEETLQELAQSDGIQFEFYAMDYNIDDEVSLDELMLFYSLADESVAAEDNQRVRDGKFSQEDLAQAQETMLNLIMEENPELEDQLQARMADMYKQYDISGILTDYDYNADGQIEDSEFVTLKSMNAEEENKPEAKADAFAMFSLVDSAMGNSDGVITEDEIGAFIDYANEKGMSTDEYYEFLLQKNFKAEDAGNHEYYQSVLEQFQALAQK